MAAFFIAGNSAGFFGNPAVRDTLLREAKIKGDGKPLYAVWKGGF